MRNIEFCADEYYHVYNRGNNKQPIFRNDGDRFRLLFAILFFQAPASYDQIGRLVSILKKNQADILADKTLKEFTERVLANRFVELVNFAFMPNHFHLTVRPLKDNAISLYLHKVLTSYTKYWNTKYKTTGHLFAGSFKAVHVPDNDQLLYLSEYIHRNPRELPAWKGREHEYPWSSFQDYVSKNRWGDLLASKVILEQFESPEEYKTQTDESQAKSTDEDEFELSEA